MFLLWVREEMSCSRLLPSRGVSQGSAVPLDKSPVGLVRYRKNAVCPKIRVLVVVSTTVMCVYMKEMLFRLNERNTRAVRPAQLLTKQTMFIVGTGPPKDIDYIWKSL